MTQDEIVKMAREAGLVRTGDKWVEPARWGVTELVHFYALVAVAEREACAEVCDRMWRSWLDSPEENEPNKPDAEDCAKAIRRRRTHERSKTSNAAQ